MEILESDHANAKTPEAEEQASPATPVAPSGHHVLAAASVANHDGPPREGVPAAEAAADTGRPQPIGTPPTNFVIPAAPPSIGLELGAANRFVTREAPAAGGASAPAEAPYGRPRTNAEAKAAAEAALRAPARDRERELGLGPEGPVLAALGEAASASTAPIHGRAVFVAVADRTGMIVGIDVLECDGARSGWANAAALAKAALKGKKLRMPSTATRAEMRIELTSEWKLPSGHDPGVDVEVLGLPVAKGEGKQSSKVTILDPIPKLATVELAPDVKVPIPVIAVDILAVKGDPADLGAKPRRVVHTRLLDSKVL